MAPTVMFGHFEVLGHVLRDKLYEIRMKRWLFSGVLTQGSNVYLHCYFSL